MLSRMDQLGERDRKVLEHYFQFNNKKAAYKHIYKKAPDYQVDKFFNKGIVKELIKEFKEGVEQKAVKIMEDQGITVGWVQSKLKTLVEFNIRKFIVVKDKKFFYDFSTATDDDWYCISELAGEQIMKEDEEGLLWPCEKIKLKANCKMKALELLGKTVGAYTDKIESNTTATVVFDDSYEVDEDD